AGPPGDHIARIPVRPVLVMLPGQFFMLAVRGSGASQRPCKLYWRSECRDLPVRPSREPSGHFLEHPAISVRIAKRGERTVAAPLGIQAAHAPFLSRVVKKAAGV